MRKEENNSALAMRAGFTLMEILVAVAIIGILGAVAVTNVTQNIEKSKITAATETCSTLKNAATSYYLNYKKYPSSLKDLVTARGDDEPLVDGGEGALEDPWGNEYKYEQKGKKVVIISAGPDGEFGGEDDIRSDVTKKTKKD